MSWGSKSAGKGGGKGKDGGKHREPKTWGGSKPPKVPKSGKHAKGGKGKGGAADGLDKWG